MTRSFRFLRSRHRIVPAAMVLMLVLLAGVLLPHALQAQPQPLPITELAYSAKFVCVRAVAGPTVPPNPFQTLIEVHNPHSIPVDVTIKWVEVSFGVVIAPYTVTLPPNGALELDCDDLYAAGCPPICGLSFHGFVEIRTPQQLKVVAVYNQVAEQEGLFLSASVAKKNLLPFFFFGVVRHSGAFLVGDTQATSGDVIRHETLIAITNMSNQPVNANINIVSPAGVVHSFPLPIPLNGFAKVTENDLPAFVPRPFTGTVVVQYPDIGQGALLDCEEIIQKYVIAGPRSRDIAMSVVEVQPIPLR